MRRAAAIALALALTALVTVPGALRAGEEEDTGKQLFLDGMKLVAEGKVEEGCRTLYAADKLLRGVSTALELGACWEKASKPARAHLAYGVAATRAASGKQLDQELVAKGKAAALEAKLAFLKVVIAEAPANAELRVQGSAIPKEAWAKVPVEPGTAAIEVSAPGYKKATKDVTASGVGVVLTVEIPKLESDGSAPPPPPPPASSPPVGSSPAPSATPPEQPKVPLSKLRIAGIGAFGGVVLFSAIGAGLGGQAIALNDRAKSSCAPDGTCDAFGYTDRRDAFAMANAATAMFVLGGAALVAGVVLVALPEGRAKVAARPAGLSLEGTW